MALSHLSWLLACATLLVAMRRVSADLSKTPWNPIMEDTCPVMVRVEDGYGLAHVALQETLEFYLNPNLPQMSMRFQQDDMLYKATVDGTMVVLWQCDKRESNCTVLDEGGTKSKDLLTTHEYNRILVKYIKGQITVDVNTRSNVMGGNMRMTKEPSENSRGIVTFLVPPSMVPYSAILKIPCTDAPPQIWTGSPDSPIPTVAPTVAPSLPERPYKTCPIYQVEVDHPSIPATLGYKLTLAVFPSHSALHLIVRNDLLYLKVHIDGSRAELLQCEMAGRRCTSTDEVTIDEAFIDSGKWNFVTLSLFQDEIIISINERKEVLRESLQTSHHRGLKVAAVAPRDASIGAREHFVAFVNIKCEAGSEHNTMGPAPTQRGLPTTFPIQKGMPTKAPIVETTVEPDAPGISRTVIIVVGVLVGVLLIIALAIIISTVMKRRSAAITESSPLQNQQQQQGY